MNILVGDYIIWYEEEYAYHGTVMEFEFDTRMIVRISKCLVRNDTHLDREGWAGALSVRLHPSMIAHNISEVTRNMIETNYE